MDLLLLLLLFVSWFVRLHASGGEGKRALKYINTKVSIWLDRTPEGNFFYLFIFQHKCNIVHLNDTVVLEMHCMFVDFSSRIIISEMPA